MCSPVHFVPSTMASSLDMPPCRITGRINSVCVGGVLFSCSVFILVTFPRISHVIKEVLYLGMKSCPHRAATSDLVQHRTLLVYVEDWRMSGLFVVMFQK